MSIFYTFILYENIKKVYKNVLTAKNVYVIINAQVKENIKIL